MAEEREPVELGEGVSPAAVFQVAAQSIDLAYRQNGENAYVRLLAVEADWLLQQAMLQHEFDTKPVRFPTKFYCSYCKNRRRNPTDLWDPTPAYWEPCFECCDADAIAFGQADCRAQLDWFVTGPGAAYAPLRPTPPLTREEADRG